MKIAAISDLHLDENQAYPVLMRLAEMLAAEHANMVLVAGDITECADVSIDAMDLFEELCGCPVYYVPGNHDLWRDNVDKGTTDEVYQMLVDDYRCLAGKTHIIRKKKENLEFALVGDIGWYDYSFANPVFNREELDQMQHEGRTWQDKLKNQWTDDNMARCEIQLERLEKQLKEAGNLPVIVLTHMVPIREFCVPESPEMWKYFNGFLGSEKLGELFEKYNVKVSISGHVHYRKEAVHGSTRYICPCLGYTKEWKLFNEEHGDDLMWQLRDSVHWIEMSENN